MNDLSADLPQPTATEAQGGLPDATNELEVARNQLFDKAILKAKAWEERDDPGHAERAASFTDGRHYADLEHALETVRAKGSSRLRDGEGYFPRVAFQANGVLAVAEVSASTSDERVSFRIGESGGPCRVEDILELVTDDPGQIVPKTTKRHVPEDRGYATETVYELPNGIRLVDVTHVSRGFTPEDSYRTYVSTAAYAERLPVSAPASEIPPMPSAPSTPPSMPTV